MGGWGALVIRGETGGVGGAFLIRDENDGGGGGTSVSRDEKYEDWGRLS